MIRYKKERQEEDSLGETQSGKVIIEAAEPLARSSDDSDNEGEELPKKKTHVIYGYKSTIPVVVVTNSKDVSPC